MNINATLFVQMAVFFVGAWITMKFIWPPLNRAIEERQKKIADGLAAADRGEHALEEAKKEGASIEAAARAQSQVIVAQGEKRGQAIIEEAKALGFSDAAVISTDQLVFVPEYRVFCEDNLCGNYDKNPACPPQSGTVEEMKEHALKYEKTLILQTMQDGLMDYKKAKLAHNKLTEQLAEKMKEEGITDLLIMSAGPYKHNSCMSAYCVDAQKMADAAGMLCWTSDGMIRYFSQVLFRG